MLFEMTPKGVVAFAIAGGLIFGVGVPAFAQTPSATPPAEAKAKNWSPPTQKIYAQALVDAMMAKHPELLSLTFHGVPPGMTKTYTMFAGSYPERIGNPDDPDDIDVSVKGITIIDPRWGQNSTRSRSSSSKCRFAMQAKPISALWSSPSGRRRTTPPAKEPITLRLRRCAMNWPARSPATPACTSRRHKGTANRMRRDATASPESVAVHRTRSKQT